MLPYGQEFNGKGVHDVISYAPQVRRPLPRRGIAMRVMCSLLPHDPHITSYRKYMDVSICKAAKAYPVRLGPLHPAPHPFLTEIVY